MSKEEFKLPDNFPIGYYRNGLGPVSVDDMITHVEDHLQRAIPYSTEEMGEEVYRVIPAIYMLSREEVTEFAEIPVESSMVSPKFIKDSSYYLIQDLSPRLIYRKNYLFEKGNNHSYMNRYLELSHPTEDLSSRFNDFILISRLGTDWLSK